MRLTAACVRAAATPASAFAEVADLARLAAAFGWVTGGSSDHVRHLGAASPR